MSHPFEVHKKVVLPATPEQVWHAIATPEGQAAWSPDPDASTEGMDVESAENERLAIRTPTAENGGFHAFEYLIEAQDGATTVLRFVHSGDLGDDWAGEYDYGELTGKGWDMYLHTLAQYLEHFPGRPTVYVEAQGPESSAAPEAWHELERALGLEGPVELGQHLHLTPEGLPVLDGVVDYVEPGEDFLALRTAEGLLRFHGMAVMGLPVAIGHYYYADVDRESLEKQWKAWLEGVFA